MPRERFIQIISMMSACGVEINAMKLEVWYLLLHDLSEADLKAAVLSLMTKNAKFMPGDNIPAMILETARDLRYFRQPQQPQSVKQIAEPKPVISLDDRREAYAAGLAEFKRLREKTGA